MKNPHPRIFFVLLLIAAYMLRGVPVIHWPFSWLATFFHEISHGLAAMVTGGTIVHIELHWDGSGLCRTRGGWPLIFLWAGYAGTAVWGVLIYQAARGLDHVQASQWLNGTMATLLAGSAFFWGRDLITWLILIAITGLFILQGLLPSSLVLNWILRFCGVYVLVAALRAPLHLLDGQNLGDGTSLANLTGVPELIWVMSWELMALLGLMLLWRWHERDSHVTPNPPM
jgi:hypothetical protein